MERGLKRLERWRRLVASKPSTSVLTAREEDFLDHSDGEGQDFSVVCLFYLPGSCFPVVVELGRVAPWILGKSLTDDLYSGDAANLATRYSGCVMTSTHERRREAPVSPNLSTCQNSLAERRHPLQVITLGQTLHPVPRHKSCLV